MEKIGEFAEEQQKRVYNAVGSSFEYQGFNHCIIGALIGNIECNGSIDITKSVIEECADRIIQNARPGGLAT